MGDKLHSSQSVSQIIFETNMGLQLWMWKRFEYNVYSASFYNTVQHILCVDSVISDYFGGTYKGLNWLLEMLYEMDLNTSTGVCLLMFRKMFFEKYSNWW